MNDNLMKREHLSALVDGEASPQHMQAALAYAESDEGQQAWRMYHLIGDVLRSPELAHHSQHDVLSGVRAQMAREPRPGAGSADAPWSVGELEQIAPAQGRQRSVGNGATVLEFPARDAANASVFRWKMAAGFASVAAVAAIGWGVMLGSGAGTPMSGTQLALVSPAQIQAAAGGDAEPPLGAQAQSSAVVAVAGPNGQSVMLRDPRLDELLAAQPQNSSAANLQMPASFLRNANFASTRPAR